MEICQIVSILQNDISKIHMLRLLKCQKILKNKKIHYLKIIETKQNVYITTQYRNIRKRWVILKKKNPCL